MAEVGTPARRNRLMEPTTASMGRPTRLRAVSSRMRVSGAAISQPLPRVQPDQLLGDPPCGSAGRPESGADRRARSNACRNLRPGRRGRGTARSGPRPARRPAPTRGTSSPVSAPAAARPCRRGWPGGAASRRPPGGPAAGSGSADVPSRGRSRQPPRRSASSRSRRPGGARSGSRRSVAVRSGPGPAGTSAPWSATAAGPAGGSSSAQAASGVSAPRGPIHHPRALSASISSRKRWRPPSGRRSGCAGPQRVTVPLLPRPSLDEAHPDHLSRPPVSEVSSR